MADKVNIGEFDTEVFLFSPEQRRGDVGQVEKIWTPRGRVFAKVVIENSDEVAINENLISALKLKITTYTIEKITHEWRVQWGADFYEIVRVQPLRPTPFCEVSAVKIME